MTHRKGEDYSLKPLTEISKSVVPNSNPYFPFGLFQSSFIDQGTVTKLGSGTQTIPKDFYKKIDAVGFLDSLHDFKSDFFDSQCPIKGKKDEFSFKKFGFTFLLHGGYPNLNIDYPRLLIQTYYSYLNRIPRPLDQNNLENYFSLGNIYNVITNNGKGNMYILPNTRSSSINKQSIYNQIKNLYNNYRDSSFNNRIKLVVDFQLNLFDIISKNKPTGSPDFCILYTAETITDPAPKPKAANLDSIFGYNNWYIEQLTGTRSYNPVSDDVGGNVEVTFSNLNITNGTTDLENSKFHVDAKYKNGSTEESITVEMNSKANTIQTIKNIISSKIERAAKIISQATDTFSSVVYEVSKTNRMQFYTNFNSDMNTGNKKEYTERYTIYYARKRLGDTLQGRICLPDKLTRLKFNTVTKSQAGKFVLNTSQIVEAKVGAVLVTHDRMLFSYAVIKNIPTILDLKDNMILFVPPVSSVPPVTSVPPVSSVPPVTSSTPVSSNTMLSGLTSVFKRTLRSSNTKVGGSQFTEEDVESVMNNVDDLIRFLYFYDNQHYEMVKSSNNFRKMISEVNSGLQNESLSYAYLGEYYNNCLVIAPNDKLDERINKIKEKTENNNPYNLKSNLCFNPTLLDICINDHYFINVEKINRPEKKPSDDSDYYSSFSDNFYLRVSFNDIRHVLDLDVTEINRQLTSTDKFAKTVLNKLTAESNLLSSTDEEAIKILYEDITINFKDDISFNYARFIGNTTSESHAGGSGNNNQQSCRLFTNILKLGVSSFLKSSNTDNDNNNILNTDFNILNDPANLFQNNITILYFLLNLLRSYELSFIGYQEGIDAFYTKINESYILSDMLGVTNLIPHNIEFYVFLKLILQDYSEANLNTINYALFEYYLYIFKSINNIYSRFQGIKSYLLDTNNYTITITPEIIGTIKKDNIKSLTYFHLNMKKAIQISQTIIEQNYTASQSDNYDIVYKNANDYSLKLCGFTEMKTEFITKTVNIVSSMMSKGLLLKYVADNAKFINTTSDTSDTSNTSDTSDTRSLPVSVFGGVTLRKKRIQKKKSQKRKNHTHKKKSKRRKNKTHKKRK